MSKAELNQLSLLKALNWAYDQALAGIPGAGFDSAVALAESYRRPGDSPVRSADRLIRWQVTKAGTAGFMMGLGGALTLPLTIPLNVASTLILQLRMIAGVAHLGGHDLKSDQVRSMAFACLCGSSAADVLKGVGVELGRKLTQQTIKRLSVEVLRKINHAVGYRLVTMLGEKGLVNFGRFIPLVGGIVSGGFDASTTLTLGTVARRMFVCIDAEGSPADAAGR
jgi:hypothetical protein